MIRVAIKKGWACYRAAADRPFATAMAVLAIASAVTSVMDVRLTHDILSGLVAQWILDLVSVSYGVAGLLLLVGIAKNRTDVEGAGCALLFSGLLIRGVALVAVMGFSLAVLTNVMFYVIFAGACVERFLQCVKGEHIVLVRTIVEFDEEWDLVKRESDDEKKRRWAQGANDQ